MGQVMNSHRFQVVFLPVVIVVGCIYPAMGMYMALGNIYGIIVGLLCDRLFPEG